MEKPIDTITPQETAPEALEQATDQFDEQPPEPDPDQIALYLHPGEHEWLSSIVDDVFGRPVADEIAADETGKYLGYILSFIPSEEPDMQLLVIYDAWGDEVGEPALFQRDTLWEANEEDLYSLQKTLRKEGKFER